MSITWNGKEFTDDLERELGNNLEKAAIYLKTKIKENIGRNQDVERSVGEKGVWFKGQNPSKPGEFPKRVLGDLQKSIAHEMTPDRKQAFVGTNLFYGKFLEQGTSKAAARPFLRPTLNKEQDVIAKIISTGTK